MAQRIMQYQAALQLAGSAPQMYDLPRLHRQMLDVLGIKDPDQIIPLEDEIPARDPISENMDMLNEKPVKAFQWQDHEAHITAHMAASEDPKIQELVGKSPSAAAIQASFASHVTEHIAFEYRVQIEKQLGASLPPLDENLPPEVENDLSRLVAQAAEKVLQASQAEAQQQEVQEQAEDPIVQMRQKELQIREMETMANIEDKKGRLKLDYEKMHERNDVERERISSKEEISSDKIEADILKEVISNKTSEREEQSRERIETAKVKVKLSEIVSRRSE